MKFVEDLQRHEFYCEADEEWQFTDGSAAAHCTSSAILVTQQFGGAVLGYYSMDNPSATIGLPDLEGHDFALIGNRWLVDYWAWRVNRTISSPIMDLKDPDEIPLIHRLYGPASAWHRVHSFTKTSDHARTRPLGL